jgi:transcriptional regulator
MYVPEDYRQPSRQACLEVIAENPWARIVTAAPAGLVITYAPVLIDPEVADGRFLVGHLARANAHSRSLETETMIVFEGPHGYVSPSWYRRTPAAPTYNYVAVHVRGTVEILGDPEQALAVVEATTRQFEHGRERPWSLGPSLDYAKRLLADLVAFRFHVTEIEGAFKLSQDQDRATRERVIAGLEAEPELARGDLPAYMRRFAGPR